MKLAVVGYGYWGRNIARVVSQSDFFELDYICDSSAAQLAQAEKLYPSTKTLRDFREIPDDVEVVALITPVASHYEQADYFLDQGKHVLIAKPFCENLPDAKKLAAKAKEKNLCIFVDHTFLFNPAVQTLKKYIGKIGLPLFVTSQRLNLGLYRPDVNVLFDLMPHDISIISYLFDSPIVKANTDLFYAAKMPQADIGHSNFTLENGLNGTVTVSWLSPYKIRQMSLIGTDGMLHYDDNQVMEKVKYFDKSISIKELTEGDSDAAYSSRISYRSGDMFSPGIPSYEALVVELKELQRAIQDKEVRAHYQRLNLQIMQGLHVVSNAATEGKVAL